MILFVFFEKIDEETQVEFFARTPVRSNVYYIQYLHKKNSSSAHFLILFFSFLLSLSSPSAIYFSYPHRLSCSFILHPFLSLPFTPTFSFPLVIRLVNNFFINSSYSSSFPPPSSHPPFAAFHHHRHLLSLSFTNVIPIDVLLLYLLLPLSLPLRTTMPQTM